MSAKFSLKDHLFNAESLGDLAAEYAAGLPGFDADGFLAEVLPGLQGRELMQRLDWIADCLQTRLPEDFPAMAAALEAAMPPELDPTKTDDDFGRFIHAVPGILAVRHGLEHHRDRALDLLEAATKRFSMEFYLRPFLNRWPGETLARLDQWCLSSNYHLRRLVSEGTRPRLPWAKAITLDPMVPLRFLDRLHADPARYVTRSVANHLNDISKLDPDRVLKRLRKWQKAGRQDARELAWMTKHALRTLIKDGHPGAMEMLGYRADAPVTLEAITITPDPVAIGGRAVIEIVLSAAEATPVLVDYLIWFHKPNGAESCKVFKLKQAVLTPDAPLRLSKTHVFKGNATTFTLHPGPHRISAQVNGRILGEMGFALTAGETGQA
ncbi:hypothetical protein E2K80_04995 [Rhodophyticola sp. CCM32]|uniref:hypothetical protein n=1 Tax=Rhodophyticola sp. CCM32 TaxID=2916397 RepID=UPI00107F10B5|nr:hypothetical protein [Rhodophyticola sp. CCM32]QBY00174.1 hypothetical protein E2K80_04995 [Rhodophyticola sp. CCM32]